MKYRLAIFDMDGTLTEERLDFPAIRRDIGLPADGGIIERIAELSSSEQPRAHAILDQHELAAADSCRLHEGAADTLAALRSKGIKTAILTRNSAECARRIVTRYGLVLDHIATREDTPHKPHRDSILNITRKLAVLPKQTLMIGDYLYDLQAAQAAGVDSALLWAKTGPMPAFAPLATYCIRRLGDLLKIVEAPVD